MTIGGYFIPTPYQKQANSNSSETTNNNLDKGQVKTHIQQQIQQRVEDEKEIKSQISQLTNIGRILNIRV